MLTSLWNFQNFTSVGNFVSLYILNTDIYIPIVKSALRSLILQLSSEDIDAKSEQIL